MNKPKLVLVLAAGLFCAIPRKVNAGEPVQKAQEIRPRAISPSQFEITGLVALAAAGMLLGQKRKP